MFYMIKSIFTRATVEEKNDTLINADLFTADIVRISPFNRDI